MSNSENNKTVTPTETEKTYSTQDIMEAFGITRSAIYKYRQMGIITGTFSGNRRTYSQKEFDALKKRFDRREAESNLPSKELNKGDLLIRNKKYYEITAIYPEGVQVNEILFDKDVNVIHTHDFYFIKMKEIYLYER